MSDKTAVLVVDVQADFTEAANGALAVRGTGRDYLEKVSAAVNKYVAQGLDVYACQDWHPADHCSFAGNNPGSNLLEPHELEDGRSQIMWPDHCVQFSPGSELLIDSALFTGIVRKGCDRRYDSYSAFADDGGVLTGLENMLKKAGVGKLIVFGLATDYCVKFTAMHALEAGFEVRVLLELCRGVDPATTEEAMAEMKAAGIEMA